MNSLFHLLIIIAAVAGLLVANYIRSHKASGTKMVCVIGADCEAVVRSKYSTFLKVPLEYWGMIYYVVIAATHLLILLNLDFLPDLLAQIIDGSVILAFAFSLYLAYIQSSRLKNWCTWCLASLACTTVIFLAVLGNWWR